LLTPQPSLIVYGSQEKSLIGSQEPYEIPLVALILLKIDGSELGKDLFDETASLKTRNASR
jgi:hypothetical protein